MKQALAVPRTKTIISSPTPERGGSPVCQSAFAKLPHQQQRARKKRWGTRVPQRIRTSAAPANKGAKNRGPSACAPKAQQRRDSNGKHWCASDRWSYAAVPKLQGRLIIYGAGARPGKQTQKEAAPGGGEAGKGAVHGLGASRPFGGYRPQRPPPPPSQAFADRCIPSAALTSRAFPSAR